MIACKAFVSQLLLLFRLYYFDCVFSTILARILVNTRTTTPSEAVLNVIYTTIGINNLPVYDLQTTNQELCTYPDFLNSTNANKSIAIENPTRV